MKLAQIVAASSMFAAGTVIVAAMDVGELETLVLSGEITPENAIAAYCEAESVDKTQDAFCACPEEALQVLKDRLKSARMDAS